MQTEHQTSTAQAVGGFNADRFEYLATVEASNFWFRARNRIIIWFIQRYAPRFESFMEIGCGTGFVLKGIIEHFGERQYFGTEYMSEGIAVAAKRLPRANIFQMDARKIPFSEKFDLIGSFDVIEHIDDDRKVLAEIYSALKPGGLVVLTVPQHRWLWSRRDVHAHHVRRYERDELHGKLEEAGFELVRSTSFVFFLLPLLALSRFLERKRVGVELDTNKELNPHWAINRLFESVILLELCLIRLGVNFPYGTSRIVVGRKTQRP